MPVRRWWTSRPAALLRKTITRLCDANEFCVELLAETLTRFARRWGLVVLTAVLIAGGVGAAGGAGILFQAIYKAVGGTSRTAYSKLSDVVSVKDFCGDTIPTDASACLQAAYAAAPTGHLWFPCGTYNIASAISIAPSFLGTKFEGENAYCVTIKASSAMTGMFSFTDVSSNGGFEFHELTLDGNHLADKGIVSTKLRYIRIDRVHVVHTVVAAVDLSEGWDENITNSRFTNNDGDGLRLGTNSNNVQVRGNVISTQPGWGILATWGLGIGIYNNDISANELGGIYVVAGSGTAGAGVVNIKDNYFEGNAAHSSSTTVTLANGSAVITGVSATDVTLANANVGKVISAASGITAGTTVLSAIGSTITMSANATANVTEAVYITVGTTLSATAVATDIMINGSADATLLSNSFPVAVTNIEGNTTTSNGAVALVFIDPGTAQTVRVIGNSHAVYSTRTQSTVSSVGAGGAAPAMTIEGNQAFTANNGNGRRTLHDRTTATPNGGSVTVSLGVAEEFIVTPSSTSAFTIAFPTGPLGNNNHPSYQFIVIRVVNALGGGGALGLITWGSGYKLAAWTNPADGFSRTITFSCDSFTSSTCVEVSRTAADVPN